LLLLGSERAWVVHGADGIDELTTTGYTKVSECRDGAVNTFYVHPADVGLPKAAAGALRGGDAAENARAEGTFGRGDGNYQEGKTRPDGS
jgi:anthranilate phosphoribosyltransferase